ncbi:MAG: hypothetical protein GXP33_09525 [Spirochaetes bacterium]|nr:hypothetical protein [Spirochaetota bacterium]
MGLDAILGPGYKFNNGKLSILSGGGIHFSGIAFIADSYLIEPFLSYTLGAGISGSALYNFSKSFNINLSVMAGYDFIEVLRMPDLPTGFVFSKALTMGVSAGFGFSY